MRRYTALDALAADQARPAYLALGTFDGVHLGHRSVITTMLRAARSAGTPGVVLTFAPHPLAVLRPDAAPPLLADFDQRAAYCRDLGVDALVELRFDATLAAVPAAVFVQEYLCRQARARRAFVGADFTFGARAAGTAETLAVLGRQACGLETTIVPLRLRGGAPISSTRIRQALGAGRVGEAARLLGHPFTIRGPVVAGDRRGTTLGFPTANLPLPPTVAQPAPGVYAVRCHLTPADEPGQGPGTADEWDAVANLGRRPTVGDGEPRLEVHLLGFSGDLYGRCLEVAFIRRLRAERRFPDLARLGAQIAKDVERARAALGRAGA